MDVDRTAVVHKSPVIGWNAAGTISSFCMDPKTQNLKTRPSCKC